MARKNNLAKRKNRFAQEAKDVLEKAQQAKEKQEIRKQKIEAKLKDGIEMKGPKYKKTKKNLLKHATLQIIPPKVNASSLMDTDDGTNTTVVPPSQRIISIPYAAKKTGLVGIQKSSKKAPLRKIKINASKMDLDK